tara:strand:- start:34 stop:564 length:531 start_codon:yes stop_codon:yes gene_type:complete
MSTLQTTNITHASNTGTANMVLASDGAVTLAKGLNTPMFLAGPAVEFTNGSSGTYKKIEFTEIYDPQGTYDASTSRFTPGVVGYYQFNASVKLSDPTSNDVYNWFLQIAKNGSGISQAEEMMDNSDGDVYQMCIGGIVYLDADDYIEVYAKVGTYNSAAWKCFNTTGQFSAFKLSL